MATLKELRQVRIDKLNKLRELGIDPYPAKSFKNVENIKIHDDYKSLENSQVIVAGRIVSLREHWNIHF